MKRPVNSEDINSINLVDDSIGAFSVHSETGSHSYNVYFRAPQDNEIPSCECIDWQKNYLPCKHILAVIQNKKYDNWKWENLPTEYRESPFYTLDIDILFKPIDHTLDKVDKNQQDCSMQTGAKTLKGQQRKLPPPQKL
jgi:hypothetical protein